MKVDNIEQGFFEGYYWKSDENIPHTLMNEEFNIDLLSCKNPFIIEAQLYNEKAKVSYSLKYVDGEYLIHKWDNVFPKMDSEEYTQISFFPNRIGEDKDIKGLKLTFLQHWVAEKDDKCNGMKVLQPKELVFVGFNKQ